MYLFIHTQLSYVQVHFVNPPARRPTVATAPQRRRLKVDDQGQYTYKKVHCTWHCTALCLEDSLFGAKLYHLECKNTVDLVIFIRLILVAAIDYATTKISKFMVFQCFHMYTLSGGKNNRLSGGWGQPPPTSVGRTLHIILCVYYTVVE